MNSIQAMEAEIGFQVNELPRLSLPKQTNTTNVLFVGSGDSYVASLVAQYASHYKAICCRPIDIVFDPEILTEHRMYIVSNSGNTKQNILAARLARKKQISTIAITSKPRSKLATYCDKVIEVNYKNTGIPTSGTISFTASMLSCISLIRKIKGLDAISNIYKQTQNEVENLIESMSDRVSPYIFLGDGIFFPVAIYGALKMNEVFGLKSIAYPLEEFCHSPIFSIKKNDKIIVIGGFNYDSNTSRLLSKKLTQMNFSSIYVDCSNKSFTEALLKSVLFIQLFIVRLALNKGLKCCHFLKNRELLKTSSDLIY